MLILPLRLELYLTRRPIASVCVGCAIVYQAILTMFFPWLIVPIEQILHIPPSDPGLYFAMFSSLFRGAGIFFSLLLLLFWIILGAGLEERARTIPMVLVFVAGAILPWFLAVKGWIAMDEHYWLGQGGVLACIGLAYALIWREEVHYFYFILVIPYFFKAGRSTTIAAFLLILVHLVIVLVNAPPRLRHHFLSEQGLLPFYWTLFYPFVVLTIYLVCARIVGTFRGRGTGK